MTSYVNIVDFKLIAMVLNIVCSSPGRVLTALKESYPNFVIDHVTSFLHDIHQIHVISNKPACISIENLLEVLSFIKPCDIRILV